MNTNASDIGLIGLAVMGQNLALNIADHGYTVSVFNRNPAKTTEFITASRQTEPAAERLTGFDDLAAFVASLSRPRKIILLVKAGSATDDTIERLLPLLERDDIIIDCGNALWTDTIRREKALREQGIQFVGSGISGGEVGARFGPSLMPSGAPAAWNAIEPIWRAVAAKVDPASGKPIEGAAPGKPVTGGVPCTAYIGENGAGHYVKMVHNGIEYIDMQLICEAYWLMKHLLAMEAGEIGQVFAEWNRGELSSYLIEITADILQQKDPVTGNYLVDMVLDTAGQKGTGQWTAVDALQLAIPANAIAAAVYARFLSALKDQRVAASRILQGPPLQVQADRVAVISSIKNALYCSKICAYAQGFQLMASAQSAYDWTLNFGEIAQIWRGGCIIRAQFLQKITDAYEKDAQLTNLMLDPYFTGELHARQQDWRRIAGLAIANGIPAQAFCAALSYFDGYRSASLPANLLQAQRDYFGAHTYERIDEPRGHFFHLDWSDEKREQQPVG
jgi:6-phosphogluconate dehydrogenase